MLTDLAGIGIVVGFVVFALGVSVIFGAGLHAIFPSVQEDLAVFLTLVVISFGGCLYIMEPQYGATRLGGLLRIGLLVVAIGVFVGLARLIRRFWRVPSSN